MEKGKQEEDTDLIEGLNKWREKHPRATMREIEEEIDQRMSKMRARLITDTVMRSASTGREKGRKEICPKCGGEVKKKGKKKRKLETNCIGQINAEQKSFTIETRGTEFYPVFLSVFVTPWFKRRSANP